MAHGHRVEQRIDGTCPSPQKVLLDSTAKLLKKQTNTKNTITPMGASRGLLNFSAMTLLPEKGNVNAGSG